jgi:hypothetical protein
MATKEEQKLASIEQIIMSIEEKNQDHVTNQDYMENKNSIVEINHDNKKGTTNLASME